MSLPQLQNTLKSLNTLLENERRALLSGNLDQIELLLSQKEKLVGQINGMAVAPSDQVATVQGKMARNQLLLESAMSGIRAIAERIEILHQARKSLQTYNARGQKKDVSLSVARSVEKRA